MRSIMYFTFKAIILPSRTGTIDSQESASDQPDRCLANTAVD